MFIMSLRGANKPLHTTAHTTKALLNLLKQLYERLYESCGKNTKNRNDQANRIAGNRHELFRKKNCNSTSDDKKAAQASAQNML